MSLASCNLIAAVLYEIVSLIVSVSLERIHVLALEHRSVLAVGCTIYA